MVVVIAAGVPSIYFYLQYAAMKKQVAVVKQKQGEDPKALIVRVAKCILLPTGEDPTVMTVTDKEKLSGQQFFANAKNGDKVLIYEKAKKAFLYDLVMDRVIEVGPIVMASPTPLSAPINIGSTASPAAQRNLTLPTTINIATPTATPTIIIQ
jgi:hypothetical protein